MIFGPLGVSRAFGQCLRDRSRCGHRAHGAAENKWRGDQSLAGTEVSSGALVSYFESDLLWQRDLMISAELIVPEYVFRAQ